MKMSKVPNSSSTEESNDELSDEEGWTDDEESDSDSNSDNEHEFGNVTGATGITMNPESLDSLQIENPANIKLQPKNDKTTNHQTENENLLNKIFAMQESLNKISLENYKLKTGLNKKEETVKFGSRDKSSTDFKNENTGCTLYKPKGIVKEHKAVLDEIDIKINGVNILKCSFNNSAGRNELNLNRPGQSIDQHNNVRKNETCRCITYKDTNYRKPTETSDQMYYITYGKKNFSKFKNNKEYKPPNRNSHGGAKEIHRSSHTRKSRTHVKTTKIHPLRADHKTTHSKKRKRSHSKHTRK